MTYSPTIGPRLKSIIEQRQADVDKSKAKKSAGQLTGAIGEFAMTRGFMSHLFEHFRQTGKPGVIADIRGASPLSKSTRSRVDVMDIAEDFRDAGATCISASPDRRFFRGSIADLATAKSANLPIMSNDVVVDQYQVLETRYAGADCVLLIVGILGEDTIEYAARANSVALDALVEVRNEAELEIALRSGSSLIGVNNRDLETMELDMSICDRLLPLIPNDRALAVAEGGIRTLADIEHMAKLGAKAVRVASVLMEAPDPYEALHLLLGTTPPEDEDEAEA
ncbi:indole-3-glycerol phosphate synthase TrpC [Methyloferula stellata]|jgi:indole-3-glycerol phosphate synthase|uniref:indole-3-glycerol phosphate synthase TrpC n=1 Tax=Methyloferula stellata TaxID=876270 RepID=UPI00037BCE71|nr:indole-3-glycerol phosphate synthase TrpC [Methyloferula stellata]